MDPNAFAGMIFTLMLAIVVGGFILLFPLSRRLGALLEERIQERRRPVVAAPTEEIRRLTEVVDRLEEEVRRLSERQDFAEQLLQAREKGRLAAGE